MITSVFTKLSWIQQFLFFGIVWSSLGLLIILSLFIYSGFNLASISTSTIEATINFSTTFFIFGILNFGIVIILKLKKVKE